MMKNKFIKFNCGLYRKVYVGQTETNHAKHFIDKNLILMENWKFYMLGKRNSI